MYFFPHFFTSLLDVVFPLVRCGGSSECSGLIVYAKIAMKSIFVIFTAWLDRVAHGV